MYYVHVCVCRCVCGCVHRRCRCVGVGACVKAGSTASDVHRDVPPIAQVDVLRDAALVAFRCYVTQRLLTS